MIRECFKVNAGIIFDAHMLKHEVGLDIDSISAAPKPLSPSVPGAIISALCSPFRWIWGELPRRHSHRSPIEQKMFVSEGEAQEEFDDAVCPVYDELDKHTYWKVVEWIPCKLPLHLSSSAAMSSYGA
jgi:hypothetical protein